MEHEITRIPSFEQLRCIIDNMLDIVILTDIDGNLEYVSPSCHNALKLQKPVLGRSVFDFIHKDDLITAQTAFQKLLDAGTIKYVEVRLLQTNNHFFWIEAVGKTLCDNNGEITGTIITARDITARKEMERQLRYLSLHDSLTGLYNRNYFEKATQHFSHIRYAPLGIIFCDVDGLKLANDTLGHTTGDELLLSASKIIKSFLRADDVVARIGGDEFAAILPNCPLPVVENACRRIHNAVEEYNAKNPGRRLSISLGFAVSQDVVNIPDLLKEADNRMYREKLYHSQSTRSAIVQTVFNLLEARDFIKEGHVDRLQNLLFRLAQAISLPPQKLPDLRLLAQFHDIGKVGIPDHILFKPGRLTDTEVAEIQRHSEIGHRIARSAPYLAHISDWILKHHEWWNGRGYPLGLKDLEIPLECRIFSIADAYDAITNDRPYRKALCHTEAIAEIKHNAGVQFDPMLVDIFIKLMP